MSATTFATQQVIASLSVRNAPYVLVTQITVQALTRPTGSLAVARATSINVAPLVHPLTHGMATQIMLQVLTRDIQGSPRLSLLRKPERMFIGVT